MEEKRLISVFDEKDNYSNAVTVLSLPLSEVVFLYHHKVEDFLIAECTKVIRRHRPKIKISFVFIKNIEAELDAYLKDNNCLLNVSAQKYLSFVLLEKGLEKKLDLIYYDGEDKCIKSYQQHKVINDNLFKFTIEDIINLNGGELKSQMHKFSLNDQSHCALIKRVVEDNFHNYRRFLNYIQKVNNLLVEKKDETTYVLGEENTAKLLKDENYQTFKKYPLFKLKDNELVFAGEQVAALFNVAGSFLEEYLYIKLKECKLLDEVMMSVVIDFSKHQNRYPVNCEIDCLALKDNRLVFASCKSNKVDKDALNEIKMHSLMFGNQESKAAIVTLDDLNINSPAIYSKAQELGEAVIDKTAFENGKVADIFVEIASDKYRYERIY